MSDNMTEQEIAIKRATLIELERLIGIANSEYTSLMEARTLLSVQVKDLEAKKTELDSSIAFLTDSIGKASDYLAKVRKDKSQTIK